MKAVPRFAPIVLALGAIVMGCQKTEPDDETVPPKPAATASTEGGATPAGPKGSFAAASAVLVSNCSGCHGAQPKEGIDVRTYETLMKGGKEGAIVKAGDLKASVLISVLRGANGKPIMPPRGPLSEDKIKAVEDWVAAGAKS